jgi:hypothetical protein
VSYSYTGFLIDLNFPIPYAIAGFEQVLQIVQVFCSLLVSIGVSASPARDT